MLKFECNEIIDAINRCSIRDNVKYDDELGISEEDLSKITNFDVEIPYNIQDLEINKKFPEELNKIIKLLPNLKLFDISSHNSTVTKMDTTFLENMPQNIERLNIMDIDLSEEKAEKFEKNKNLKSICFENNNIKNINLLKTQNSRTHIDLVNQNISKDSLQEVVDLMEKHEGNLLYVDRRNSDIAETFAKIMVGMKSGRISVSNYIESKKILGVDKIGGLKIVVSEHDIENNPDLINELSAMSKSSIICCKIKDYKQLIEKGFSTNQRASVTIPNASKLSIEDLKKCKGIESVIIDDEISPESASLYPYTRNDYLVAKSKIDDIVQEIIIPEKKDENYEKKIFAQIYKRLSKIRYDYSNNPINDRNMLGGLINETCVCDGYSEILKNVLSCFDIKAKKIVGRNTESKTDDIHGDHVWNKVLLDGEWFNTDLTWDARNVRKGKTAKYFLKSDKEFKHEVYDDIEEYGEITECKRSVTETEQKDLIGKMSIKEKSLNKLDIIKKSLQSLGKFVKNAAIEGRVNSSAIRKNANEFEAISNKQKQNENEQGERND